MINIQVTKFKVTSVLQPLCTISEIIGIIQRGQTRNICTGCSLLELDESTGLNREEAYSYFSNVKGLATYVYSQLPGDLGVLDGALRYLNLLHLHLLRPRRRKIIINIQVTKFKVTSVLQPGYDFRLFRIEY